MLRESPTACAPTTMAPLTAIALEGEDGRWPPDPKIFVFSDPMVFIHEFLLHQRNDDITAPERECTQIQCGQEYFSTIFFPWDSFFFPAFPCYFFSFFLTVPSRILAVLSVNCKTAPHFSMLHTHNSIWQPKTPGESRSALPPSAHFPFSVQNPREIPQRHYSEQCRRSQPDMIIFGAYLFFFLLLQSFDRAKTTDSQAAEFPFRGVRSYKNKY